jgi:hypothetical protein
MAGILPSLLKTTALADTERVKKPLVKSFPEFGACPREGGERESSNCLVFLDAGSSGGEETNWLYADSFCKKLISYIPVVGHGKEHLIRVSLIIFSN